MTDFVSSAFFRFFIAGAGDGGSGPMADKRDFGMNVGGGVMGGDGLLDGGALK